jgi:hypothetical protein
MASNNYAASVTAGFRPTDRSKPEGCQRERHLLLLWAARPRLGIHWPRSGEGAPMSSIDLTVRNARLVGNEDHLAEIGIEAGGSTTADEPFHRHSRSSLAGRRRPMAPRQSRAALREQKDQLSRRDDEVIARRQAEEAEKVGENQQRQTRRRHGVRIARSSAASFLSRPRAAPWHPRSVGACRGWAYSETRDRPPPHPVRQDSSQVALRPEL